MNSISTGEKSPLDFELQLKNFGEVSAWLNLCCTRLDLLDQLDELPNFRMKDNLFE